MSVATCPLCRGSAVDASMLRVEVWRDELWRVTTALVGEVPGFSYLEPHRHITALEDLDGPEAASLGLVLSRACRAVRIAAGAERTYVYVFGDSVDHLHLHLAPAVAGGPLNDAMIRGEIVEETLENGAVLQRSRDVPLRPRAEMAGVADRVRATLAGPAADRSD